MAPDGSNFSLTYFHDFYTRLKSLKCSFILNVIILCRKYIKLGKGIYLCSSIHFHIQLRTVCRYKLTPRCLEIIRKSRDYNDYSALCRCIYCICHTKKGKLKTNKKKNKKKNTLSIWQSVKAIFNEKWPVREPVSHRISDILFIYFVMLDPYADLRFSDIQNPKHCNSMSK